MGMRWERREFNLPEDHGWEAKSRSGRRTPASATR